MQKSVLFGEHVPASWLQNPLKRFVEWRYGEEIDEHGPALTFRRLCTSRHLNDLQVIAGSTIIAWTSVLAILLIRFGYVWLSSLSFLKEGSAAPTSPNTSGSALEITATFLASMVLALSALTGVAGGVLNWTYQTGSKRIGVIDLFASEIGVLCRVLLVVNFALRSVEAATKEEDPHALKFTSAEDYTPVYNKSISDLQPLDADVVTSVTRFYTYRKTMLDYIRYIGVTDDLSVRADFRRRMIFMQYLMYEAGRDAIALLIEFQPNKAENLINILCSEITLAGYLNGQYRGDFRGLRLALRIDQYDVFINELRMKTEQKKHLPSWAQANTTFPELDQRYIKFCEARDRQFSPDI